jgi:predicted transcriptional regulator
MITKNQVLETVQDMPDQIETKEIIDRLLLLEKINTGLAESKAGKTISDEELEDRLAQWLV